MSRIGEMILDDGGIEDLIERMRKRGAPEPYLRGMAMTMQEELLLSGYEKDCDVDPEWVHHAVLYRRCRELSDLNFELTVDFKFLAFRCTVATHPFEGATSFLDARGAAIEYKRLMGVLLMQAHMTMAKFLGVLPIDMEDDRGQA
jgi:hypothetical protein